MENQNFNNGDTNNNNNSGFNNPGNQQSWNQQGNQFNQGQQQFNQQGFQQQPLFYFDGTHNVSNEQRAAAIVTYFGLLGFIIALVIHSNNKTRIGAYHMRQAVGLMLTGVICSIAFAILMFIPIIGWLAIAGIGIGLFVIFIMGIVYAASGKFAPLPVVGKLYENIFGNAFE